MSVELSMNHLLSMTMLLAMFVPQPQNLPDAFHQLPEPVREKATVIVIGTYGQGRSPCIFMPDGSRIWARESWFNVTKVYRGKVGGKTIYVNDSMLPKTKYLSPKLTVGRKYLILLQPGVESQRVIEAGEYVPVWDALHDEEIIAILELK